MLKPLLPGADAALPEVTAERDLLRDECRRLEAECNSLRRQCESQQTWVPPGHFYSPITSFAEVKAQEQVLFGTAHGSFPGIELNEPRQRELFNELSEYAAANYFPPQPAPDFRYYYENDQYGLRDAILLQAMIRRFRPRQIVEAGCGFSSAVILDTNERFFRDAIACTFIEPFPDRLLATLKPEDPPRLSLLRKRLQDVELELFGALGPGDFLMIDSTHVAKAGSDVNYLVFHILPALQPGVYIHIHDIYCNFEYPHQWVYEGRSWNESYLLRAFLQYNQHFSIELFASNMETRHTQWVAARLPAAPVAGSGSLWLKKH